MKKNSFILFAFLFVPFLALAEQQTGTLKPSTVGIDALISGINLKIEPTEEPSISYSADLVSRTKLSFIEHKKRLRIRSIYPAEGNLTIYVPKKMILESCMIYASSGSVELKDVKAAFCVISMCEGSVSTVNCNFKTSSFTVAAGKLSLGAEFMSAVSICVSGTETVIFPSGSLDNYSIEWAQSLDAAININGKILTGLQGSEGNRKAKKRIMLSAASASVMIKGNS